MTRLELAKHTVDTIYETLLTLVNKGLLCAKDAESLLYSKTLCIRETLVNDIYVSPEDFDDFLLFISDRVNFFRDIYLSSRA